MKKELSQVQLDAQKYFQAGINFRQEGKLNAAITAYRQAIEINSDNTEYYCSLGELLVQTNQLEERITCYHKAIEINPNWFKLYHNLGLISEKNGKINQTIENYNKAIEYNPNIPWSYSSLGNIFSHQKSLYKAVNYFKKAIKVSSIQQSFWFYIQLADVLVKQDKVDEAINSYQDAIRVNSSSTKKQETLASVHLKLADLLNKTGQYQKAIDNYIKATQIKQNQPVWVNLNIGYLFEKQGDLKAAADYFKKAIDLEPKIYYQKHINSVIVGQIKLDSSINKICQDSEINFRDKIEETDKIIVDVGAHNGDDTEFYLRKGFKCIAIEANPELCEYITKRCYPFIQEGKLLVKNIAIANQKGNLSFFISANNSELSSIFIDRLNRINRSTTFKKIEVTSERLDSLLSDFYQNIYHIKIDIEGADNIAIKSLMFFDRKPPFLSFEYNPHLNSLAECIDNLSFLQEIGYLQFKIISQGGGSRLPLLPYPPLEGKYLDIKFTGNMSGPFGLELPGNWLNIKDCIVEVKKISSKLEGWFDIHAKYS